jgi:hypothetical protein
VDDVLVDLVREHEGVVGAADQVSDEGHLLGRHDLAQGVVGRVDDDGARLGAHGRA